MANALQSALRLDDILKMIFLVIYCGVGQTCSTYEPHIAKPKLQRAATWKSENTNLFAMYISRTQFFLQRLAKAILHATLATTVLLYNISTLCNKNKTNISFFGKLREPPVALRTFARVTSRSLTTPDILKNELARGILEYCKWNRSVSQHPGWEQLGNLCLMIVCKKHADVHAGLG